MPNVTEDEKKLSCTWKRNRANESGRVPSNARQDSFLQLYSTSTLLDSLASLVSPFYLYSKVSLFDFCLCRTSSFEFHHIIILDASGVNERSNPRNPTYQSTRSTWTHIAQLHIRGVIRGVKIRTNRNVIQRIRCQDILGRWMLSNISE